MQGPLQFREVTSLKIEFYNHYAKCILNEGPFFLIDIGDLHLLGKHRWRLDKMGYVRSGRCNLLHRMIMDPGEKQVVDHINGDPSDCRRSNLRVASQKQNSYNTRLAKNNKSGYKGVSWDSHRNKYAASISVDRRTVHLGRFENKEEAAEAYDKAASFYFGKFALLNKEIRRVKNEP